MKRKIVRFIGLIFAQFRIYWNREVSDSEINYLKYFGNYVILTKTKWCFTNLFIKGKYKHAAIITRDCKYVIEATTHGSRKTPIKKFLSTKNKYRIFRMSKMTQQERDKVESIMYEYVGRPYDWLFFWEPKSLYCSELVALIYNRVRDCFYSIDDRVLEPSELLDADIEVMYEFNERY